MSTWKQALQFSQQVLPAVEATIADYVQRVARDPDVLLAGRCQEGDQIASVLRASVVISRENLGCYQMRDRCDADYHAINDLYRLGRRHNFWFNSRRGEERIDQQGGISGGNQADGRQTVHGPLFYQSFDTVISRSEELDKSFGIQVVGNGYCKVKVLCEAGFRPG